MRWCSSKKKKENFINLPTEVVDMLGKSRFSEKELLGFFNKCNEITRGIGLLNKKDFGNFLNSMGIFPNPKVKKRIFEMVDDDSSLFIEFGEIIIFLDILIKGNEDDKISFIFRFITHPYFIEEAS